MKRWRRRRARGANKRGTTRLHFALGGTSNNCHRSSGAPNLPANDSALFSFRFCAVHPKDVRDCQLRQLFEVPLGSTLPSLTSLTNLLHVTVYCMLRFKPYIARADEVIE